MEDLYKVLGVAKDAEHSEIRKTYKKKASGCHPDKNPDNPEATKEFQALVRAYTILSDAEKRERYDRTGSSEEEPNAEEMANNMIAELFFKHAENDSFLAKNYITPVTKSIQASLKKCKSEKTWLSTSYKRLEYLISKTEGTSSFAIILNRRLSEIKGKLEHAKTGVKVMSLALELLQDYAYTGDTPMDMGSGASYPWNSTDPFVT